MAKPFEFTAVAKTVEGQGLGACDVGAWTDGIGVYSDNDPFCAYPLRVGKTYKITIEEVTQPSAQRP